MKRYLVELDVYEEVEAEDDIDAANKFWQEILYGNTTWRDCQVSQIQDEEVEE